MPLGDYGAPELGTVTGSNEFFAISEATRAAFDLCEEDLKPICPPGSRHLKGLTFGSKHWRDLRDGGERVWLLYPDR